jgi:hypothetical protein
MSALSVSESSSRSVSGQSHLTVPPLRHTSSYASWKPLMSAYLMQAGLDECHYKESIGQWDELCSLVKKWKSEESNRYLSIVLSKSASGAASSTSSAAKKSVVVEEDGDARKAVIALIERSRRAYALLYHALNEDLRALVRDIPEGYAFGIWDWLEKRFQNTEDDNVAQLFKDWNDLVMNEDESFDAYKSRVDQVHSLLIHANSKPPSGQYVYTLLHKLRPMYKQAILALKASEKLKNAEKVDWNYVVTFVNSHERVEQREDVDRESIQSLTRSDRNRRNNKSHSGQQKQNNVQCFRCDEFGHMVYDCPDLPSNRRSTRARAGTPGPGEDTKKNRRDLFGENSPRREDSQSEGEADQK